MFHRSIGALSVVFVAQLTVAAGASAQSGAAQIEQAAAALDAARFEEAERLYGEATSQPAGLSRADVLAILRGRALARAALQRREEAQQDFAALLALDPGASLGEEAPPSVRALLDEQREAGSRALQFEIEATETHDGVQIRTTVVDDFGLVQAVRVTDRSDTTPRVHEGRRVVLEPRAEVRYSVELIGWGGATLMSDETGRTFVSERLATRANGDDDTLWIGLGVGGAAVVVGVVIALVLAFTPSGRTQPGRPMEIPF